MSLNKIGALKEQSFDYNESNNDIIADNIKELKNKLASPASDCDTELCDSLLDVIFNNDNLSNLTWRDPIASQVLDEISDTILFLDDNARRQFMKPKECLQPKLNEAISSKCRKFLKEYKNINNNLVIEANLTHDSSWKEPISKQKKVVDSIMLAIKEIWNNPIYSNVELLKRLNEGTYFTDVINPLLRATLAGIYDGDNLYFTVAELQSVASKNRKSDQSCFNQNIGKKPDALLALTLNDVKYELIFLECSRIICSQRKKDDDYVKLWRECNDGISWSYNSCNPAKNNFGIVGIQIFGTTINLNFLMRDSNNLNRYFHLQTSNIPLIPCEDDTIIKLIRLLLTIRNITIINISLLNKAHLSGLQHRSSERAATVNTPPNKKLKRNSIFSSK